MTKKTDIPELPADKSKWSEADFQTYADKLREGLEPAKDVLQFLKDHMPINRNVERWPIGLISSRDILPKENYHIVIQPWIILRPKYIILSEKTASSFDILDFRTGNIVEQGTSDSIPCETFSVKYYANSPELILNIQKWSHETVNPAQRIIIDVRNSLCAEPIPFRGILWCDCALW